MKAREQVDIERRRSLVRRLRFSGGAERPYALIVDELAKHGITVTAATVSRDVAVIRRDYARFSKNFDPLEKVGERAAKFRAIANRAMRRSAKAKADTDAARLLKVAVIAWNAEIALLQATGLLPNSLGVLQVDHPTADRVPSGVELQQLFDSINVHADDLVSEAERDQLYGDFGAVERHARAKALNAGTNGDETLGRVRGGTNGDES